MRILIAEDETELSAALGAILRRNNYSVDVVDNGTDAFDYALNGNYDGIILDVMMPGKDGFQVMRELRSAGNTTPVLFLTAKSSVEDKISGLDLGADDYMPKPFDMGELLARLRAMTRRKAEYTSNVLSFADLTLDRATYEARSGSESVKLGNKEFQMLEMLMVNPGHVISTEQFMEKIWGYDSESEINVVWVYVSTLRKRLASLGASCEIKVARGVGYFLAEKKS